MTVKTASSWAETGVFASKKGAASPACAKNTIFHWQAIPVNYFASALVKAKLSYLQPFTGEKDTFWAHLKEGQKRR